jgi:hypothetical protein
VALDKNAMSNGCTWQELRHVTQINPNPALLQGSIRVQAWRRLRADMRDGDKVKVGTVVHTLGTWHECE